MAKLSNIVKNDVLKRIQYEKLVAKVDIINTAGFVSKTTYDTDKSDLEKKISDVGKKILDTSAFVKKADFKPKITEVRNISGLATNSALTAVENKISDTEKKITEHNHDKYITTPEFNKLTTENFKVRSEQANLIKKTDLDTELKKKSVMDLLQIKQSICLLKMN